MSPPSALARPMKDSVHAVWAFCIEEAPEAARLPVSSAQPLSAPPLSEPESLLPAPPPPPQADRARAPLRVRPASAASLFLRPFTASPFGARARMGGSVGTDSGDAKEPR